MRSGTNWVGTNWRANQSQTFHFSASRVGTTRKVKISWWMTTECNDSASSPTYYLCYKNQKLVVDGQTVVNWTGTNPSYQDDGHTVYRGFADKGSWLDNHYDKKVYHDLNGDYIGINRYVQVLGTKWKTGSFEKTADNDGDIKFSVSGSFGWDGTTNLDFSKSFEVKGLVPEATFSIKYNKNISSIEGQISVKSMPSTQTKKLDKNIKLSTNIPIDSKHNFEFAFWATNSNNSSLSPNPGATVYNPGDSYKKNSDLSLYAIWTKARKTLTYNLNGGSWNTGANPTVTPVYNSIVKLSYQVNKYGSSISGWYSNKYGKVISPSMTYTVIDNDTLTAQYVGNKYTIRLINKDGGLYKTLTQIQFNAPLYGDFRYSVDGYECIGWSTYSPDGKAIILNYNSEDLPVIPNLTPQQSDLYNSPNIYIGNGNYQSGGNRYTVPNAHGRPSTRSHMVGDTLILYPVLKYTTSFYVYSNNSWHLALPYVYSGNSWHECSGYVYNGSSWKQ